MQLSSIDMQVLSAGLRERKGFHLLTKWYFGWEPLPYQYVFHHIPVLNTSFLAGVGCISADTQILAPNGSETPVAELSDVGKSIDVVSWNGSSFVAAKASQPFHKGRADLYDVILSNGRKVRATLEHRFLTPNGYVRLAELRAGQQIGVLPTPDRSTQPANVLYIEVKSINWNAHGDFYDLVVPDLHNYVGNGIVHHNSGKTSSVAASMLADCLTLPGFRALNASVTAGQAQLTFEMIDTWRDGSSLLNNLITDVTLRPFPIIEFWNRSTFEFRTAGLGAKFIRGYEYDRINYDEAGLDEDGSAIKVLRGRLRGVRPDGTPRMARLDVTGTPSTAVWFRERFEMGLKGHPLNTEFARKYYSSLRVTTFQNTRLTKEQIDLIVAEYPPELADVELRAEFPDWGLSTFPHGHVQACVDREMNDDMYEALYPDDGQIKAGWESEEWPRVGVVFWHKPAVPGHLYIMAGDPGVDTPPRRNSPCIIVFDVTNPVAEMVYFHWASGKGSYDPFMNSYKRAITEYRPIAKGIDVTGPQKSLNDLGFEKYGIQLDGLHFGGIKEVLVNSLLSAIVSHDIRFPMIQGVMNQLQTYRRDDDKDLDQDIVMTLGMCSYLMRQFRPGSQQNTPRKKKNNYIKRMQRTATTVGRRH